MTRAIMIHSSNYNENRRGSNMYGFVYFNTNAEILNYFVELKFVIAI